VQGSQVQNLIDVIALHGPDLDFLGLMLLRLRNRDRENTILHTSLDVILINTDREGERAGEFTDRSLRDPVFGLGRLGFLVLLVDVGVGVAGTGGDGRIGVGFGAGCVFVFVLDGGLVSCWLVGLLRCSFDGFGGSSATLDES
jgi:hypothetical protein